MSVRGALLLAAVAAALGSAFALLEFRATECHQRRCEHGEPVYDVRVAGDGCWCRERPR